MSETELANALRRLTRWVGRGIVDGAYKECCAPGQAEHDLEYAEKVLAEFEAGKAFATGTTK